MFSGRRGERIFEFQPVGYREEDGIVSFAFVVLRIFGRGIKHVGLYLHQKRIQPVNILTTVGCPGEMMEAG